ncbi:MAG: flagellar hook-associated protein FlgL [Methylobacter sp.]|nr:flagellar hook-associated protein FlgL [Methylobacter sp.]
MRISTVWSQQLTVNAMASKQTQLSKVQQQLSTGLKVLTPADDAAGAVKVLDFERTIAKTEQYQNNIATTRGRLNLTESALASANDILANARELTIRARNDTLNSEDRLSIKIEVDQLIEQLAGTANTQNANGEFIFSGDLSTAPTFEKNATTGEYVYQGGQKQRALQISPTRQIADGELGFNVFEDVDSVSPAKDENGKRSVFNTLKALSDGLAATFTATPAEITGDKFLRYGLDYTGKTAQFNLVASAEKVGPAPFPTVPPTPLALAAPTRGGLTVPTIDLSGKKFADVEGMVTEINNQLATTDLLPASDVAPNTGIPAGSNFSSVMQARSNGNKIEFVSVATSTGGTGTGSIIAISNVAGTFLADAGFTNNQSKTGADLPVLPVQVFQSQLGDVLTDLDAAQGKVLQASTSVGVRLNVLDDQEAQNEKFILDTETTLAQVQDLDYAEAMSRFQLLSISLQAAQQAFSKARELSLFNYLR